MANKGCSREPLLEQPKYHIELWSPRMIGNIINAEHPVQVQESEAVPPLSFDNTMDVDYASSSREVPDMYEYTIMNPSEGLMWLTMGMGEVKAFGAIRRPNLFQMVTVKAAVEGDITGVERIHREMALLCSFNHQNIMPFFGRCAEIDGLVTDFCFNSLKDLYLARPIDEPQIREYVKQVADGMDFLHQRDVIHCDLKCENIMLKPGNQIIEISNFGSCRCAQLGAPISCPCDVRWMSPETIRSQIYSKMTDVWSFGVVIWELHHRSAPTTVAPLPVHSVVPHQTRRLLSTCWKNDPSFRPEFSNIKIMLTEEPEGCLMHLEPFDVTGMFPSFDPIVISI